jgi:hypothetical protein
MKQPIRNDKTTYLIITVNLFRLKTLYKMKQIAALVTPKVRN